MPLLDRLLRTFGFKRIRKHSYQLDTDLIPLIESLADREARPEEEVVSDLLSTALARRAAADEKLTRWEALSPRERHVAALACLGYTNRQIAQHMGISPATVNTHMSNILVKFNLHSKAELRRLLDDWDFSAWS
jgi:DNA-binding NarL/FixJ family response regulator